MFTALALLLALSNPAPLATPLRQEEVSLAYFQDRLAIDGTWTRHAKYGWVWFPDDVELGWRPYTHGRWTFCADDGWVWDSEEEWGWATDHYGRWVLDEALGWIWVPGTEWAPAWVAWRSGDGYLGWAPLPPEVAFAGDALAFGPLGIDVIEPAAWVFVEERLFCHPHLSQVVLPRLRALELCPRTKDVTHVIRVEGRIHDHSLPVETIEAATGSAVPRFHVHDVESASAASVHPAEGNEIDVFRPRVLPTEAPPPRPNELDRIHTARQAWMRERHRLELAQLEAQQHREPPPVVARESKEEELARTRANEARVIEQQRVVRSWHERELRQLDERRRRRAGD